MKNKNNQNTLQTPARFLDFFFNIFLSFRFYYDRFKEEEFFILKINQILEFPERGVKDWDRKITRFIIRSLRA